MVYRNETLVFHWEVHYTTVTATATATAIILDNTTAVYMIYVIDSGLSKSPCKGRQVNFILFTKHARLNYRV